MDKKLLTILFTIVLIISVEGRKTSRSRSSGSGRGSSKKTSYNPQPAPTSFSYQQPSAPKPSLFGWQEKPAQKPQNYASNPSSSHSYPSSPTGLSGGNQNLQKSNVPQNFGARQTSSSNQANPSYPVSQTGLSGANQPKQINHQDNLQKSNTPQNYAGQQTGSNNQNSHSYPSANGLSGSSGGAYSAQSGSSGGAYPAQSGSSGGAYPAQSGVGYSSQQGSGYSHQQTGGLPGPGAVPPPYSGYNNRPYSGGNIQNNYGNNYHHPQGPPPPYSNFGGYGGHGSYNTGYNQMPGYFGNSAAYGKGFGGVSRTKSALTGVGIAGAGVGTLLTGLALWNLARSTGNHHHTVIYDNRGQPVAVAPANNTDPNTESMLADLVNCTLTISNVNSTEVLAIPCAIATSFTPEADIKDSNNDKDSSDNTECTVTVVTKAGKEFMTTIPCSILLKTAAENNVTEGPLFDNTTENINATILRSDETSVSNEPSALRLTGDVDQTNYDVELNCTHQPGDIIDPINPCFTVTDNFAVIPLLPANISAAIMN